MQRQPQQTHFIPIIVDAVINVEKQRVKIQLSILDKADVTQFFHDP